MTTRSLVFLALFLGLTLTAHAQEQASDKPVDLSPEERLFGLSELWKEAAYNFAYFDLVPTLDWDAAFRETMPQVLAADSLFDYYRVLQRFLARLNDGHTRIFFPDSIVQLRPLDVPRIQVRAVGRRAIVTNVEVPLAPMLPIGSEIERVDGMSIAEHLDKHVFPYLAVSTEHVRWRDGIRGLWSQMVGLLYGPKGSTAQLTVRTPDGERLTISAPRDWSLRASEWTIRAPEQPLMKFEWFEDDVAYVAINTFNEPELVEQFDEILPELRRATGLILDIRENGGGMDSVVHEILRRITKRTLLGPGWSTRVHNAAFKAWGRFADDDDWAEEYRDYYSGEVWHTASPIELTPGDAPTVTAPVAVLIGEETQSSAENFLIYLDGDDRFTLIGQPTMGSSGQPLFIDLPGGGRAWICTKRNTYPDGRVYIGTGVLPHVLVEPHVEDIRAGRDVILESALDFLRSGRN